MNFRLPSRAACTLTVAMFGLVATTLLAQQLGTTPIAAGGSQAGKIATLVCEMIEANHISHKPIDDTTSSKLVDEFIKMLDPQKLYFLQSDIDRFNKFRYELDDLVKAGNLDFAMNVFETFQQRMKARMEVVHKLIDADHDFTVDESIEIDAKDLPWAKTAEELNERWRKQIKYFLLLEKIGDSSPKKPLGANARGESPVEPSEKSKNVAANGKPTELDPKKRLHKRYNNIQQTLGKTEPDEVVEMYLTALCSTFDPHSSYMSPRSMAEFQIQMGLKLEGIGAALMSEDGYTVVKQIIPGGPAKLDGRLKVNDKIIAVGNGNSEFVDVVDLKLSKVVDMIRGKSGTKVRLRVLTADTGEMKIYELIRKHVELKAAEVKGEIIDTGSRLKETKPYRVGVVHIPSFYRDFQGAENGEEKFKSTARDVKAVLQDFQARGGVDAVVVDLRNNGGGSLIEAIEVSGLFINEGPVVQVKDQNGRVKPLSDDEQGVDTDKPLVLITNRLSASASEIFAGVIKDYNRGLIVGDRATHGKGTVQNVTSVGKQLFQLFGKPQEMGALKLTIQQFYRVNGESTQNLGVSSDVPLPSLLDNMDLGEQFLDNAMPYDKISELKRPRWGMVNSEMLVNLRDQSHKRVAASPEFQKTEKDIEKYLARKQRKTVSLNEQELRNERVEEEQKTREKAENTDDATEESTFLPNAYNNEVLAITADYLTQLRAQRTAKK
jgi:carboxyl-terminal processing protease